jgi:DNA-binding NarL/FixJ family response regulator
VTAAPRFAVLERAAPAAAASWAERLGAQVHEVRDLDTAVRAVLTAVHGAPVVVLADAPREVVDRLCDDLRRLGEVVHLIDPPVEPMLSPTERELLAALLAGCSLGEAAEALHLSRRTADRRLVAARRALGVTSTPAAVRRAAELGIAPARPR